MTDSVALKAQIWGELLIIECVTDFKGLVSLSSIM